MSVHRRLLLAEAVLLLAPETVLAGLGFAWSARLLAEAVRGRGNWQDPVTWMALAIAAGLVGCLAGWWLLVRYLRAGDSALRQRTGIAWTGASIGAAAALGGTWLALLGNGWIFAIGLLALLPLAHLFLLRQAAPG